MNAVLGGWMAGYAMAILSTFALTYLCIQPAPQKVIQKYLDVPGVLLAVPFSIGTGVVWTMTGMLLGSAYKLGGFADTPGVLGAPSWTFLFIMGSLSFLPIPPLLLLARQYWWIWVGMSLSFLGLFGWLMPVLAER
ncbi:MAG: hypothetical protein AB7J35_12930 [Dehalococcoidia bacterium]